MKKCIINNDVNEITLSEASHNDMGKVLGDTILTLLREGEVCRVALDSIGSDGVICVVQHEHDNDREDWGGYRLAWISPEELEQLKTEED